MSSDNDNNRPLTPSEEDCCGNACNPCVFDIHKRLLEEWEKKKLINSEMTADKNYLSLTKYKKFLIVDKSQACKDGIFIDVVISSENEDDYLLLSPSQHIIIKLISASKPYTPISWDKRNIKLFVKLYSRGATSEFFRELKIGGSLLIRGPYGEFHYKENSFEYLVMFSIGSGIAAVYPIVASILKNELEETRVHMFLGFQSLSHVPLKDQLRRFTDYWNFQCTFCLSLEAEEKVTGINIVNNRLTGDYIDGLVKTYSCDRSLILICGTSDFNETTQKIVLQNNFSHYHVFS